MKTGLPAQGNLIRKNQRCENIIIIIIKKQLLIYLDIDKDMEQTFK